MIDLICILMAIVSIWGICEIIKTTKENKDKKTIKKALNDAGYV